MAENGLIGGDQMFDADGINADIRSLIQSMETFSKAAIGEMSKLRKEFKGLQEDAGKLGKFLGSIQINAQMIKTLDEYNKKLQENAEKQQQTKQKTDELGSSIDKSVEFMRGATEQVDRLTKEIVELSKKEGDQREELTKLRKELGSYQNAIKAVTAANKAQGAAIKEAQGQYNRLSQITRELEKELRSMDNAFDAVTGAINKNNKAAVALQQQILKNNNALKGMDATMGKHQRNVGNYSSAFAGLKNGFISLAAATVGVTTGLEAVIASVRVIATMERQQMALRNASSSSLEYAKNLDLIRKIASETGAPLDSTTDALRKFTGATKGTAIEGSKARYIFEQFSKTFTANGATADEFNRATKALSDMMSKGTIQAEELKGQLGDALPGALKIFADANNVSQRELLKMMQAGELLAEETLPKVARMQEIAIGDKAQQNLKTLAGGWQSLNNEVQLTLTSFNNSGIISRFFGKIIDGVRATISGFRQIGDGLDWIFKKLNNRDIQPDSQPFESFKELNPEQQQKRLNEVRDNVRKERAKLAEIRRKAQEEAKNGDTWELARLNEQIKTQAELVNAAVSAYKKYILIYDEAKKKRKVESDPAEKTVARARALVDSIPEGMIGENGKARLTKDQAKELRALKDEIIGLYNTLPKDRSQELHLKGLLDTIDELLSGRKEPKKGKKTKEELTELEKHFKDIEKTIIRGLNEIDKNGGLEKLTFADLRNAKEYLEKLAPTSEKAAALLAKVNRELSKVNDSGRFVGVKPVEITRRQGTDTNIRDVARDVINNSVKEEKKDHRAEDRMNEIASELAERRARQQADEMLVNRRLFQNFYLLKAEERNALQDHLAKVRQLEDAGRKKEAQAERALFNEKVDLMKKELEKRQELIEKSVDLAASVGAAIFDVNRSYRDQEIEALRAQKEHELSLVGDNKKAQEKVEKQFAARELEMRKKQAKADKAEALFNIALNTAMGIVRATSGGPLKWWEIPVIIAAGAINAAAVAAKPLPEFYKGTTNSPEGFAMVGERGPEIVESPSGEKRLIEKPSLVYLEGGSKVRTAFETRQLMDDFKRQQSVDNTLAWNEGGKRQAQGITAAQIDRQTQMLVKAYGSNSIKPSDLEAAFGRALDNRPEKGLNLDWDGINEYERRKGNLVKYIKDTKSGF